MTADLEVLSRAHALFAGGTESRATVFAAAAPTGIVGQPAGAIAARYRDEAGAWQALLERARHVDAELARVLAQAHRAHREAHRGTGAVLAAARVHLRRVGRATCTAKWRRASSAARPAP